MNKKRHTYLVCLSLVLVVLTPMISGCVRKGCWTATDYARCVVEQDLLSYQQDLQSSINSGQLTLYEAENLYQQAVTNANYELQNRYTRQQAVATQLTNFSNSLSAAEAQQQRQQRELYQTLFPPKDRYKLTQDGFGSYYLERA